MIYIGDNQISGIYLGDAEIFGIYAGDLQLYPMGEFQGLKLTPKSLSFASTGETKTIKVKSSAAWEIQPFTGDWLSFSQMSGEAGTFEIQATALPIEDEDRSLEIVFNTVDMEYSAVLSVEQSTIRFVNYIYSNVATTDAHTNCVYIATPFTYDGDYGRGSWRVVGKKQSNLATPNIAGGTSVSSTVCNPRLISYENSTMYLDYPNQNNRASTSNFPIKQGGVFDLSVKYKSDGDTINVINNLTESTVLTKSMPSYSLLSGQPLGVETTHIKVNTFQLWDRNGRLTFDGHAAIKDGIIGLYDNITGQMFTVPEGKNIYWE